MAEVNMREEGKGKPKLDIADRGYSVEAWCGCGDELRSEKDLETGLC